MKPRAAMLYETGLPRPYAQSRVRLPIERLSLQEANEGFDRLADGAPVRQVVVM
jgi:hypothetical protein